MKISPSKQTNIYLRAILDLLHSESREDRMKQFERRLHLHEGRLERIENKKYTKKDIAEIKQLVRRNVEIIKKHEKKSFEKKK